VLVEPALEERGGGWHGTSVLALDSLERSSSSSNTLFLLLLAARSRRRRLGFLLLLVALFCESTSSSSSGGGVAVWPAGGWGLSRRDIMLDCYRRRKQQRSSFSS
jgi:hypothetical protein